MSTPTAELEPIPAPEPPSLQRLSPGAWVKENLLYSKVGVALTVAFGAFALWALSRAVRFVFITGRWEIVRKNLALFMVGFFPRDQLWRPWLAILLLTAALAVRAGTRGRGSADGLRRWWPLALFALAVVALVRTLPPVLGFGGVVAVGVGGRLLGLRLPARARRWTGIAVVVAAVAGYQILLSGAPIDRWGGLQLTLYLAVAGIAISFPLGVLFALGRRSTLPAVRAVSVAYIELFRGVPLVTVLFMGDLLIGFFLPPGSPRPGAVNRAIIGLVLFTAAYLAEIVRGGLQSVPRGQIEAAQALGLPTLRITAHIVLPQALRAVIPAIVGQFISLFKDTSLVATIGLFEILSVAQTVTAQPEFLGLGLQAETLVFASFVYWVGAYWMSRTSQRLERRLGVGER